MPTPADLQISNINRSTFELVDSISCNVAEKGEDIDEPLPSISNIIYETITFTLVKWSILISIAQIILLGILIYKFGTAPISSNPYLGPSVNVLIRFGAKDAELIIVDHEYWRVLTAIMLHAGVYHLLGNISLQILICGHLEHSWGVSTFFVIYFSTGLVGYLSSCCFLYDSVSVGSSGSIMGLLAAWLFDLIFSIHRMKAEGNFNKGMMHSQIIMLCSIATAIVLTLATSWNSGVDWASHSGGCIYGAIWACILFPHRSRGESKLLAPAYIDKAESSFRRWKHLMQWTLRAIFICLLLTVPILLCAYMIYYEQDR